MKTFFFPTVELHLQKKKKVLPTTFIFHFTEGESFWPLYKYIWIQKSPTDKMQVEGKLRVVYGLRMPVSLCSLWLAEVGVSHCSSSSASSSASSTLCEEPGWCRGSPRETVPSPDMEYLSSTEVFFNQGITKAIAKRPWNTYIIVTWSNTNSNLKISNFFPPEGRSFPLLFFSIFSTCIDFLLSNWDLNPRQKCQFCFSELQ